MHCMYPLYISSYNFPYVVSKSFLDYFFCHLGEQMDGWIKHLMLLHSVDHVSQQCCPKIISSSWFCFYYFSTIAPLFHSFGYHKQPTLAVREIETEEKSSSWRNTVIYEVVPLWIIRDSQWAWLPLGKHSVQ